MDERYYRPSGRAPMVGIGFGALGGSLGGIALAVAYAYLILYLPIAGYITFLIALAFGALTGLATGYSLRHGSVRSPMVGFGVGAGVAIVAFYASWVVWIYGLLHRADIDASFTTLLLHPGTLWNSIVAVNGVGAWTIKGATPTGIVLWILWGCEAVLILGPAVFLAAFPLSDPFCERCERWCEEEKGVRRTALAAKEDFVTRLEARDWAWVAALASGEEGAHLSFDLHVCPTCEEMHALTVQQVTTAMESGKPVKSTTALLEHLLLNRQEAAALRAAPPTP